jgi:sphingomyelin phosphodiesterase 2
MILVFTIFISWLATTMLYQGFVYGRWERNALMNAIEDMEVYRKVAESRTGSRAGWS